jgi:hypothetical protein
MTNVLAFLDERDASPQRKLNHAPPEPLQAVDSAGQRTPNGRITYQQPARENVMRAPMRIRDPPRIIALLSLARPAMP